MKVLRNIDTLKKTISNINNLGFVPTMGDLHMGHISLIKESKKKCKKTLVSIYINPKQFNSSNDFLKYPRNLQNDLNKLKKLKIDFVFLPKTKEIYKKNYKKIILPNHEKKLCAKYRKGHFEGVLNIMNRFIDIIKPNYVFMGEKDYQQLYLINKYLIYKYKTKIHACKTIRDKNFSALSSRNSLLKKIELRKIGLIAQNLLNFKKKIKRIKNVNKIINFKKKELSKNYNIKIEYLEARNEKNLSIYNKKNKFRLFFAYYIRNIRLIDNFN